MIAGQLAVDHRSTIARLVSRDELVALVWPNTIVEESNVKVDVAALRRALGEGRLGRRYIATISGRGYRFVAPFELSEQGSSPALRNTVPAYSHNLPVALTRAIGRADTIDALLNQLPPRRRFVTILGPGGIGKTTVALAAAEALIAAYGLNGLREVGFSRASRSILARWRKAWVPLGR